MLIGRSEAISAGDFQIPNTKGSGKENAGEPGKNRED